MKSGIGGGDGNYNRQEYKRSIVVPWYQSSNPVSSILSLGRWEISVTFWEIRYFMPAYIAVRNNPKLFMILVRGTTRLPAPMTGELLGVRLMSLRFALSAVRDSGMALRPSFVSFTPWTTLEDYLDVLDFVEAED